MNLSRAAGDPGVDPSRPPIPQGLRAQLPDLCDLAIDLAVGGADLVRAGRAAAVTDGVGTKTTRTDVVTVMDRACEDYLRRRLAVERPGEAVFGEEAGIGRAPGAGRTSATTSDAASTDAGLITWVVDPIDGTVNYLYGRPEYAVSVAAVIGDPTVPGAWRPVAGAVTNPETREVYYAFDGGGAYLRSWLPDAGGPRRLAVTGVAEVAMVLLATGFGYDAQVRREQARALLEILPAVRDIRRGGSAALDLCTVASGVVDAYAERGVHAWDVAAGWVIATEAGAEVTTWESVPGRPPGVLAAPPAVAAELRALLARAYRPARG